MADETLKNGTGGGMNETPGAGGGGGGTSGPSKKAETVTVDVSMLEDILKEVQGLRGMAADFETVKKDRDMLLEVVDKGRLQNWQARNSPQGLVRSARAWVYDDKLVKGTVMLKNIAFTDNIGRVHTDQVLKVIFEDTSEKETTYDEFMKSRTLLEGDIISRSTDDLSGQTFYKLKFKDGKEIEINYLFLN